MTWGPRATISGVADNPLCRLAKPHGCSGSLNRVCRTWRTMPTWVAGRLGRPRPPPPPPQVGPRRAIYYYLPCGATGAAGAAAYLSACLSAVPASALHLRRRRPCRGTGNNTLYPREIRARLQTPTGGTLTRICHITDWRQPLVVRRGVGLWTCRQQNQRTPTTRS